jgi:hypothetical protein
MLNVLVVGANLGFKNENINIWMSINWFALWPSGVAETADYLVAFLVAS